MSRNAGPGAYINVAGESDTDVMRLHSVSGNDTAFDFQGQGDYIYIGSISKSDINSTQTGPSTWVLTQAGGSPNDSLTINFAPGTEPASEAYLRNQSLTDNEYTPPGNGNGSMFTPTCFTAKSRILTPNGLMRIGDCVPGDLVMTADSGPQCRRDRVFRLSTRPQYPWRSCDRISPALGEPVNSFIDLFKPTVVIITHYARCM